MLPSVAAVVVLGDKDGCLCVTGCLLSRCRVSVLPTALPIPEPSSRTAGRGLLEE